MAGGPPLLRGGRRPDAGPGPGAALSRRRLDPVFRQPDAPTPTPEAGGGDGGTGGRGDAEPAPAGSQAGAEGSIIQSRALLLPISEYDAIPGVAKAARVGEYRANLSGVRSADVRLLAVDRLDFGRVIYFRPDYAEHSLGELMNRLGEQSDAVLIPVALAQDLQVGPGDPLVLSTRIEGDVYSTLRFTIVDTFTHFPTMYGADRGLVVVGNLDYLQMEMGGAIPYRVWMRVQPGAKTEEILDGVQEMGVLPLLIADRGMQIAVGSAAAGAGGDVRDALVLLPGQRRAGRPGPAGASLCLADGPAGALRGVAGHGHGPARDHGRGVDRVSAHAGLWHRVGGGRGIRRLAALRAPLPVD